MSLISEHSNFRQKWVFSCSGNTNLALKMRPKACLFSTLAEISTRQASERATLRLLRRNHSLACSTDAKEPSSSGMQQQERRIRPQQSPRELVDPRSQVPKRTSWLMMNGVLFAKKLAPIGLWSLGHDDVLADPLSLFPKIITSLSF